MKKGKLIVLTGPSGVGKATVEKLLFNNLKLKLDFSISATTRKKRKGEIHGKHYFFISIEKFNYYIFKNYFIEWNEHFGNKYGTLKSEIIRIIKEGNNAFLEIESCGAMNIIRKKQELKSEIITIFLVPPSINCLKERIKKRGTETDKQINLRLSRVYEEMSYISKFQFKVINDEPKRAAKEITQIISGRE